MKDTKRYKKILKNSKNRFIYINIIPIYTFIINILFTESVDIINHLYKSVPKSPKSINPIQVPPTSRIISGSTNTGGEVFFSSPRSKSFSWVKAFEIKIFRERRFA